MNKYASSSSAKYPLMQMNKYASSNSANNPLTQMCGLISGETSQWLATCARKPKVPG